MNDSAPLDRLRSIYNAVFGANIAFLPVLAIYLVTQTSQTQTRLDAITVLSIWLLTTAIVVNEWWATFDLWRDCPPTGKRIAWHIIFNLLYVAPLLALPFSVWLEAAENITLKYYAMCLIALPVIDLGIVLPHLKRPRPESTHQHGWRTDVWGYIFSDIVAIFLFVMWVFFISNSTWCLLLKTGLLGLFYLVEFWIYYRFKALFAPRDKAKRV